jgi:hypothetical protein
MDLFAIDFTPQEISILRQALDIITITGKDAKTIAGLQMKLESEIAEIASQLDSKQATKKTR